MNSTAAAAVSISFVLPYIPVIIALLIGLALCLARRDRLGPAAPLAIVGFVLALLVQLTGPLMSMLPVQMREAGKSVTEIATLMGIVSLLRAGISAASFGFLAAAILRGRAPGQEEG